MLFYLKAGILLVIVGTVTSVLYMASISCYGQFPKSPLPVALAHGSATSRSHSDGFQSCSGKFPGSPLPDALGSGGATVQSSRKLILSWTGFFKFPQFMTPSLEKLKECGCSLCDVTNDKDLLNVSDAVLFHLTDVNVTYLPSAKKKGQRWAVLSLESPVHRPTGRTAATRLGPRLDWTVSYRLDSDFPSPYGRIRTRSILHDGPGSSLTISRTRFSSMRTSAWMVSHCRTPSRRESLVGALRRRKVRVDIFGKCGSKVMLGWSRDKAYKYLATRYKFYLSLENALCKDYVTEKVYYPLKHGLVPVVYGGANYRDIFPPHSYIDVLDFPSLDHFADYLLTLAQNYTLYSRYQEWRKYYVVSRTENSNHFFCDLCAQLHAEDDGSKLKKWRPKNWFRKWWFDARQCLDVHSEIGFNFTTHGKLRQEWYIKK